MKLNSLLWHVKYIGSCKYEIKPTKICIAWLFIKAVYLILKEKISKGKR